MTVAASSIPLTGLANSRPSPHAGEGGLRSKTDEGSDTLSGWSNTGVDTPIPTASSTPHPSAFGVHLLPQGEKGRGRAGAQGNNKPQSPKPFRINGWHVLAAFVLFFAADIAVNTVFIVRAYRTFPGEVSVTPYEDGLLYDAALKQKAAQDALGWRLTAGAEDGSHIVVTAEDARGAPIRGLKLNGLMQRPATEDGKRSIAFVETAPGRYQATAGDLAGAWDLEVTATDAKGHRFIAERRLVQP